MNKVSLAYCRFKEMPFSLRFFFFPYSLIGGMVFTLTSFIPSVEFEIEGKQVSWSEWWTSGAAPLFNIIGVLLVISAIGFYRKNRFARITFVSAFIVALLFIGKFETPTKGGVIVAGILFLFVGWYFFLKKSMRNYLGWNKKREGTVSRVKG